MYREDAPRMVVTMEHDEGGTEIWDWRMVGSGIPSLGLIGAICRVQSELFFKSGAGRPERGAVLAIVWDQSKRCFDWYLYEGTPLESLCGMLDTIKALIVGRRVAQQLHAAIQPVQGGLLGPDGRPFGG